MAQVNTLPPAKPDDKVYETPLQIGARVTSQAPAQAPTTTYPDLQNLPIDPAQAATAPYQKPSAAATGEEEIKSNQTASKAPPIETNTSQPSTKESASYQLGKMFGKLFK